MTRRPFVRVSDSLWDDPDLDGLNASEKSNAIASWVAVLGYCHREKTDGLVTSKRWPRLGTARGRRLLLRIGWAEVNGAGYYVPKYLLWQQSRADAEAASAAGRKANAVRWGSPKRNPDRRSEPESPNRNPENIYGVHRGNPGYPRAPAPARGPTPTPPPLGQCGTCHRTGHDSADCPYMGPPDPDWSRLRSVPRPPDETAERGAALARELMKRGPAEPDPEDEIPF